MDGWMGKFFLLILFYFQLVIAVATAAVAQAKSVKGSADWAGYGSGSGSGSEEYTNDYITGLDMLEEGGDPVAFTEPRSGNQEKIREIYWTCK